MSRIVDIAQRGIYTDLMRKFRDEGNEVFVVSPVERGKKLWLSVYGATLMKQEGVHILGVKTLNLQKTNVIEKGIGQILVESQYVQAIKRFFNGIQFDLILYSTPPITFPNVIRFLKNKAPNAMTYLLLKDIFPQNAVDMGMLRKTGVKGILYKYFRRKEKKLYVLSDYIGCMSPANVEYLLKHNPKIETYRVEVAPNSVEMVGNGNEESQMAVDRISIRNKYELPINKPVFLFAGNLGKPQGIDFLIDCLDANKNRDDCYFLIIGNGTEYGKLDEWFRSNGNCCLKLMQRLPKEDYDLLARSCDVGLIFLDHHFTIPNFPSRLLSYLENRMPVLCTTDPVCDMGKIAEENGFGLWCESNSVEAFTERLDKMIQADRIVMGEKGYSYLKNNYLVEHTYSIIMSHMGISEV